MQTLTREQALKRIRDIQHLESTDHLDYHDLRIMPPDLTTRAFIQHRGAIQELMAIFDIKEEEL